MSRTTPPPLPKAAPRPAQSPLPEQQVVKQIRPPTRVAVVRRALIGLVVLAALAGGSAWLLDASIEPGDEFAAAPTAGKAGLATVRSWGYQLQRLDIGKAAAARHDLIVVDESLDGAALSEQGPKALARLKRKPDGNRRIVLSYLSIGEAEDYRPYWRSAWVAPAGPITGSTGLKNLATIGSTAARAHVRLAAAPAEGRLLAPTAAAPSWLGLENSEWRGNYRVRYWHPDWQALIYGTPAAAIDRIAAAGFDGVYLDRADVYALWGGEQATAKPDMVEFIVGLAAYARQLKPGFVVIMQNAEELLADKRLRGAIDGVAKEDLLFGITAEGQENPVSDIDASLRYLKLARGDGLPVLVVEYLTDDAAIDKARARIKAEGFVPYFGSRLLNSLEREH